MMCSIQESCIIFIATYVLFYCNYSGVLLAALTNPNHVVQAVDPAIFGDADSSQQMLRASASKCSPKKKAVINYAGADSETGVPIKVGKTVRLNDLRSDKKRAEFAGSVGEFEARGFTFLKHANEGIFASYGELDVAKKNEYVSSLDHLGSLLERTFTNADSGDVKSVSEVTGEDRDKVPEDRDGALEPHVQGYMRNVAETIFTKVKPDAKYVFFVQQQPRGEEKEYDSFVHDHFQIDESIDPRRTRAYAFQAHSDLNSEFALSEGTEFALTDGLYYLRYFNSDINDYFKEKRPVTLMNYWANIRPEPITNTMLALNDNRTSFARASEKTAKELLGKGSPEYSYHPNVAAGELMADNWYFASDITNEEAYVFEQFKLQYGDVEDPNPESEMNDKGHFGHNIFHSAALLEDAPSDNTRVSVESRVLVF